MKIKYIFLCHLKIGACWLVAINVDGRLFHKETLFIILNNLSQYFGPNSVGSLN